MKLIKTLLLPVLFVAMWSLTGCNEEPTTSVTSDNTTSLSKLEIPAGAVISSATFNIRVGDPYDHNITVHNVNVFWDESETWDDFYGKSLTPFDSVNSLGGFSAATSGLKTIETVDFKALVQAWVDGTTPNYGLLLNQNVAGGYLNNYYSKEFGDGSLAAFLDVTYTYNGGAPVNKVQFVFADTYISTQEPGTSHGDEIVLLNGRPFVNYIKHVLVKFDIESTPGTGCTLTPGYWKTHSEFGPAPYDATWAQLPNGASTMFFLSGQTYYEVLWTAPAGNAYYQLAFHYIAAGLNFMNGADPSAAQAAYDAATTLFNTHTPAQIAALSGNNAVRKQFVSLAGILGNYNEGIIGPGHCD